MGKDWQFIIGQKHCGPAYKTSQSSSMANETDRLSVFTVGSENERLLPSDHSPFITGIAVRLIRKGTKYGRSGGGVTKVSDGDTLQVTDSLGTVIKVRLYDIDSPETEKSNRKTGKVSKPGQPYGKEAFQALKEKVYRKDVIVDIMDIDQYRRSVGIVWIADRNINREMVAEGNAWAYRQYLDRPHASEYQAAEDQARKAKLSFWQQANPQPPWEFRRSLKKGRHGREAW